MWLLPNGERKLIKDMHDSQIEILNDQKWMMCEIRKIREEAKSDIGYPRCAAHTEQIIDLNKNQTVLHNKLKWLRNTFVGGLVSMIIAGCITAGNFLVGK